MNKNELMKNMSQAYLLLSEKRKEGTAMLCMK